jgi:hypothetical protein
VGWLEAWGTDLIDAMEALQALAARRAEDITTVVAQMRVKKT